MFVCTCKMITITALKRSVREGARTAQDLVRALGLEDSDCCGMCAAESDRLTALIR